MHWSKEKIQERILEGETELILLKESRKQMSQAAHSMHSRYEVENGMIWVTTLIAEC